ncbi:MAG: type II toxin-antitoxin system Phd/YefM family antitoxin [Proteobacteria bacterium]|nr:type II toxin-antitoxin system Phd/YefM family antitoxin [Pseudomonadota bacterium]
MEILTANKAKTQFGEMLIKVQREPVQIDKNGKPTAVVVSIENYEASEKAKLEMLKSRMKIAEYEINNEMTSDGDVFFEKLLASEFDE